MRLQTTNFTPNNTYYSCNKQENSKTNELPTLTKNLGAFPSYYCPNINFGSKFGEIDFEYDFYASANNIINNHLDKIELTKGLNKSEQEDFRSRLNPCDKPILLQFFFDNKPSILLTGDLPYFENNDKYDFVRRTLVTKRADGKTIRIPNTFIINKELTKQTIAENKELYTKRMGFKDGTNIDTIYKKLVGEDSPLKEINGSDDIIGLTLGFPKIDSILFQLEKGIPNYLQIRNRPYAQANFLQRELYSGDSVYKDFSQEFLTNVDAAIESIKRPQYRQKDLTPIGYIFTPFVPDEDYTKRIIKSSEKVLENAQAFISEHQR